MIKSIKMVQEKEGVKVTAEMSLPVGADCQVSYLFTADGKVKVEMNYEPKKENLTLIPKLGMRMRITPDYRQVEYVGRGPWENYPDRKRSAWMGHYKMELSGLMTEYIKPQDNGNRCDVRWLQLSNGEDTLRIDGLQPLCVRAWDYGEEDLEGTNHPNEIRRGRFVNLNIDFNIHGVGGADTWGKRTLPAYTIDGNRTYHYSFVLSR